MKPSSGGDPANTHDLAAVKGKLSGALGRLIGEASDDDLVLHLDPEAVFSQLKRMAVNDVARDMYEQQQFDPPPTFHTLAEELKQPDRTTRLPILHDTDRDEREGTILWDGQTLAIIARYKVGKTTLLLNLVRSLADRQPFLDLADIGLVDAQVDLHLRQVLGDLEQHRRLEAGRHGLARLDRTQQDHAVHRRTDHRVVDIEFGIVDRGLALLHRGLRGSDAGAGRLRHRSDA